MTVPTLATAKRQQVWKDPSDAYMRMPWGKHKGKWIKEIPTDYLKWCILNYTGQIGVLEVMKDELLKREPKLGK